VHLAAFKNVEEIAAEKAEIFQGLEAGGTAVLNADIATHAILAKAAPAQILRFGRAPESDFRLASCKVGNGATVVRAESPVGEIMFKLGGEGAHLAQNAVGVLAGLYALKADLGRATLALASWQPPEGRGARQVIPLGPEGMDGHFTLINESYNANPASTRAALATLAQQAGRKVAILGDMLELGASAPALHAALAEIKGIDITHTVGPLMGAVPFANRGLTAETSAALAADIGRQIRAGDVVMVKGSLGMAMAKVIDALVNLGDAGASSNPNEGE
jgi:UDP-N-acetylmuramoyl-tripeptide--D-alanyl-D-alanine ligase